MNNFNEVFRKYVTYDNIKSHKKQGFHPLFRRNIYRKVTEGVKVTLPAPIFLGLKYTKKNQENSMTHQTQEK